MSEIKKRQTIEEDLKQSNSEIKQFAYIASHDLQEPLQTIMSFITLLQEDYQGKFDPVADKYFEYINKSALRMRALITALLDYSRLGKDAEPSILETKNIVEELKTDLSKLIEKERVEINVGTLPEVFGYEVEMRQLFQNLVTNAIKFSHAERSPEISISAEQTGGNWTFSISDNGIGIDKIHLSKIFIIFKRLHRRDEYEGTGIGLAHCKKIVEMHNGKIWAESKPGLGSTFYFTIPQKLEL